ncbi:MAG: phospholipase D-like domain-containing protein [Candidatus Woesearchaeota archaeon]|nr:phospholipase D-like domain-containing protein [Candidatus Woesearchaeota archaeon]
MKTIFVVLLIFLTSCAVTSNVIKEQDYEIDIFFCPIDSCMEHLIEKIHESADIKCAFYELGLPGLIDALKDKDADVIMEDTNALEWVGTGFSKALMHNKFCVFDGEYVWTGSFNPTLRGNYNNNENAVLIRSKALAENYLAEFYELKEGIYGKGDRVKTPVIYLKDTMVENYFCPEDDCKLHVLHALRSANHSVYFMAFSFTDVDLGNQLYNMHHQDYDIRGIVEERQISEFSRYDDLKDFTMIDTNPYTMHHKVFIIDNKTVITGSYNPTRNADEFNDENIIMIHDEKIAKRFIGEFRRLFISKASLPDKPSKLMISKVAYDAPGKDEGNEYIELKNIGDEKLDLNYYVISDNRTNSKLEGSLDVDSVIKIIPKFALKNTNGVLFLKKDGVIIDYVFWKGIWALDAKESVLLREDEKISEDSWKRVDWL